MTCRLPSRRAVLAAGAAGLVLSSGPGAKPASAADAGPPPLQALRFIGPRARFDGLLGRPMIINLWASWCTSCVTEMPLLAAFGARRDDIAVLFVNSGETAAKVQSFLTRMKLGALPVALDPDRRIAGHYRAVGLPVTIFLKRDGSPASMVTGEMTSDLLERSSSRIATPVGGPPGQG